MERLFANGTYRGSGHWIDQKAEGRYTAQYAITDGPNASKIHEVERVFFKEDGTVAYEEKSTVSFQPAQRSSLWVTIQSAIGSVAGPGYVFDDECHYELDITSDNHLEFTFHSAGGQLHGMGSATNKGNKTYWQESLERG